MSELTTPSTNYFQEFPAIVSGVITLPNGINLYGFNEVDLAFMSGDIEWANPLDIREGAVVSDPISFFAPALERNNRLVDLSMHPFFATLKYRGDIGGQPSYVFDYALGNSGSINSPNYFNWASGLFANVSGPIITSGLIASGTITLGTISSGSITGFNFASGAINLALITVSGMNGPITLGGAGGGTGPVIVNPTFMGTVTVDAGATVNLYNPTSNFQINNPTWNFTQTSTTWTWNYATTTNLTINLQGGPLVLGGPGGVQTTTPFEICGVQSWCCTTVPSFNNHQNNLDLGATSSKTVYELSTDGLAQKNITGIVPAEFGIQLNTGDVTGATNASPIVLTVPGWITQPAVGTVVKILGVNGNTAANGVWIVQASTATTVTLRTATGNGAFAASPGSTVEFVAHQLLDLISIDTGSQAMSLRDENAASFEANRFLLNDSQNWKLEPDDSILLWYDTCDANRWRVLASTSLFGPLNDPAGMNRGLVPTTSTAAALTDYLAADGTWKPIPAPAAVDKYETYFRQVGTSPERWYLAGEPFTGQTTATGFALTAATLYAIPFLATRGGTLDRIGFNLQAIGASSKARLGIYANASDTNLYPAALVLDAGELDCSAGTGLKADTINQVLSPSTLYWLVLITNNIAASFNSFATVGVMYPLLGADNTLVGNFGVGWTVAQAYGTLPATFPANGSMISTTSSHGPPIIGVRFSA